MDGGLRHERVASRGTIAAGLGAEHRKETLGGRLAKATARRLQRPVRLRTLAVVGSESSAMTTKAGNLRMRNRRAEMYWRLREALDPTAPDPIALPPDPDLLADLAAVRYKVVTMGKVAAIQMRDKDEIREALGRSPDKGDAIAMTFVDGIPPPGAASSRYEESPPPDWRT